MHASSTLNISSSVLPIPWCSSDAFDGGWCASWHDFWDGTEMRFCRIAVLFFMEERKKKKERTNASHYWEEHRSTVLDRYCYLWTSNNEKLKVRSGVESVDKSVSVGVLVLEILRAAEKFKVQRACASEVGGRKWGCCWMMHSGCPQAKSRALQHCEIRSRPKPELHPRQDEHCASLKANTLNERFLSS